MKNLKKVLALVLAFACAFTMFAGAAFTDSADIKVDAEVVDTLVAPVVFFRVHPAHFSLSGKHENHMLQN